MKKKVEILLYLEDLDKKQAVLEAILDDKEDEIDMNKVLELSYVKGAIEAIEYIMDIKN